MIESTPVRDSQLTAVDIADLARDYAEHRDDWPLAPRFNPRERWYARIGGDDHHEAWLLTWLPGQGTELHDHGGAAGAFLVIEGTLVEGFVTTGGEWQPRVVQPQRLAATRLRSFGPHHVHRITNTSSALAVSIHVYTPALSAMTRYQLSGSRLDVTGVERSGVDW